MRDNYVEPNRLETAFASESTSLKRSHLQKIHALEEDFNKRIFLASGETVFDRIHNQPGQSIKGLLENLAKEAFPEALQIEVQAEEFTSFLLMVYMPPSLRSTNYERLIAASVPVVEYGGDFLTSIAFYDRYRKSYFFLDEVALGNIRNTKSLPSNQIQLARERGQQFSRYNSVSVEGRFVNSHLLLPIGISGPAGAIMNESLLDTGATITMISRELFNATGFEDLSKAPTRRFQTVNGTISAPIVQRTISIGDVSRTIDVAVNIRDDLVLIGMNLFEGYDYLIESQKAMIHLWPKEQ
ncbi:MAG: retropepsin-like domain-containing protein [Verrucomicrobia bacterium]|nr:retropepsin-like domain-containing protein [Verrucomicrobiota bacterium]